MDVSDDPKYLPPEKQRPQPVQPAVDGRTIGYTVGMGLLFGVGLSLVFASWPIGLAMGMALGTAFYPAMRTRRRRPVKRSKR